MGARETQRYRNNRIFRRELERKNKEANTWEEIKYNINAVTEKVLGNNNISPRKPWMNQNILDLIKIRNSLRETDYEEYKKVKNRITTECKIAKDIYGWRKTAKKSKRN